MEFVPWVYFMEGHTPGSAPISAFRDGETFPSESELKPTMKKMTRLLREKPVAQATN